MPNPTTSQQAEFDAEYAKFSAACSRAVMLADAAHHLRRVIDAGELAGYPNRLDAERVLKVLDGKAAEADEASKVAGAEFDAWCDDVQAADDEAEQRLAEVGR